MEAVQRECDEQALYLDITLVNIILREVTTVSLTAFGYYHRQVIMFFFFLTLVLHRVGFHGWLARGERAADQPLLHQFRLP